MRRAVDSCEVGGSIGDSEVEDDGNGEVLGVGRLVSFILKKR